MLELYHHGSSVCAAKVRFALAEKGLAWQGHYLDILRGDQFDPAYLRLNPKGVVPTLVDDGAVITESTVINEYLEDYAPDHPLLPADRHEKAMVRLWTKAVDEDLHPACGALTMMVSHRHTFARLGKEGMEKFLAATPGQSVTADWHTLKRQYVEQGLDAPGGEDKVRLYDLYLKKMEQALADQAWLAGDRFTLADVALAPYVNRLAMMEMTNMWEGGRFPRVADWFDRIRQRPTFGPSFLDWIPAQLTNDLSENGRKSWPRVAAILQI